MTKKVGNYEIHQVLGQGAYGIVRLVKDSETKEQFAMKIIEKEKIQQQDLLENLK